MLEERLADDFGVSGDPVHEALRMVQAEGFLKIRPCRRAVVCTTDPESARDMFSVGCRLEALTARLAAESATPDEVISLRDLLFRAHEAIDAEGFIQVTDLNNAFHLGTMRTSGN